MTSAPIEILLIEDSTADIVLIEESLKTDPLASFRVTNVDKLSEGLQALARRKFDLVLVDLGLPDSQGLTTCQKVCGQYPNAPIVVLSGLADEELAEQAVKSGAQDYIVKGMTGLPMLARSIRYAYERHQIQQRLRLSEEKYRRLAESLEERVKERTAEVQDLYENAPMGYHSLDANGRLTRINRTELRWLGYEREELIGMPFVSLLSPTSQALFQRHFSQFKSIGQETNLELDLVRKDGSLLPVSLNATAIYDAEGNYTSSRSTLFDNRERKQADETLRHANLEMERAMRMKDEFLASMSHELRTPLTGILGLSEALQLQTYGSLTEKQLRALRNIESSGRHLLDLINDILDLARVEAGKLDMQFEICSLGEVCQASLQFIKGMAQKKRLNISFAMRPVAVKIRADQRRLKQMLVNLLSNAVKFTPDGGALGLEIDGDDPEAMIKITVWDKGIGIKAEDLGRLFKPFVQLDSSLARQYSGTGLGLSLVQRMVELHGGRVEVQSEPGKGSRFTLLLPRLPEEIDQMRPLQNTLQRPVMIIEDNPLDVERMMHYCEIMGLSSFALAEGQPAVEQASQQRPGIILLDINLPDISGWQVLAELKTNPETQPIPVVITSIEEDRAKASALGAAGHLVKPFTFPELRTTLERSIALAHLHTTQMAESAHPQTVMVVDDNEINLITITDFLAAQQFHTVTASSGPDCLAQMPRVRPDIVLMDVQMPDMDGLEVTRRIRVHHDPALANTPIIAVTALAMPGDQERCLAAGANEYLSKPFSLQEMLDLILRYCQPKLRISPYSATQ